MFNNVKLLEFVISSFIRINFIFDSGVLLLRDSYHSKGIKG